MEHSGFWGKKGGHGIWEGRSRAVRVRDECKKNMLNAYIFNN